MSQSIDFLPVKQALQAEGLLAREYGLDDGLDPETWTALFSYAAAHDLEWSLEAYESENGEVPQAVLDALLAGPVAFAAEEPLIFDDYPERGGDREGDREGDGEVPVFDLTAKHPLKKGEPGLRPVGDITTIVLHQTAVKFGTTDAMRRKYGERGALHRRFYDVACHAAALMNGDVLLVNAWRSYVYHANAANRCSLGIEIEGLYAGLAGDPRTVWGGKPAHTLSRQTIAAARQATRLAVEQGRALGCPITRLAAHRQFSDSRIADPGQEIWQEVGLWAAAELGLTIDYDLFDRENNVGRKIPSEWDPSGTVNYRQRRRA